MRWMLLLLMLCLLCSCPALALDRPWISDTYFYWYTWNYDQELGGWMGGVYNTPLRGYYASPRYADNLVELRQASEWGLTHHFMDYWGPGWQAEKGGPRESVLMQATEDLRREGYDISMSVYQDGTDFDMAQFARNLDPGRDTEFYVNRYAESPATPRANGKPVYLIYGRNGAPKITGTDEGFRQWLERKYESLAALNRRWGTSHGSFGEIKFQPSARGHLRADSIKYQYSVWGAELQRANAAASRFGLPGVTFSWDIAFQPYQGWGYSDQLRVFGGPHSYGGIFGVPHSEDVERFIQATVAKRYDAVFFDTFKNFYHDWEIRIPGTAYPPNFCAFDRFWVQALSHYSEALLHLSWNEWWEGSNLEPCLEYGKTYCEKNLLYATIMKQCFPSIREWNRGARVAVLLNDWQWLSGGRNPDDIYDCIQALRRLNVRFDLLPDDFVTPDELAKFSTIIAPSAGVGFGYNAADEPIADVLLQWAEGSGRKLIIDDYPGLAERLKLALAEPATAQQAAPGPDMSVFVDVGEEGDEKFLIEGSSGREDWGKLPADKFGATTGRHTVRWTPAAGEQVSFTLPLSPHRDHVLRLSGSSMWDNHVTVLLDGTPAAEFDVKADQNEYEVKLPAAAVGGRAQAELALRYEQRHIPMEIIPDKYPTEGRVCNLALDWLQLSTDNLPLSREQKYKLPEAGVKFAATAPGTLNSKTVTGPYVRHVPLARTADTLSTYVSDGTARDLVTGPGRNILYVNGLLSGLEGQEYLTSLLTGWAACPREMQTMSEDIMVTPLQAGNTDILLAYNYAAPQPREFLPFPPRRPGSPPVVELRCLSQDGELPKQPNLPFKYAGGAFTEPVKLTYYGVYQATHGWVKVTTPQMVLAPGETAKVSLTLEGAVFGQKPRTDTGKVTLISHLPSMTSDTVDFTVKTGEKVTVPLTITCRKDADWGRKTVIIDVEVDGEHSYFWRTLTVADRPELRVSSRVIDGHDPRVEVALKRSEWAFSAPVQNVRVTPENGEAAHVGDGPNYHFVARSSVPLPLADKPASEPRLEETPAVLDWECGGAPERREVTLDVARYPTTFAKPPGALAPVLVCNPLDTYLENYPMRLSWPPLLTLGRQYHVRDRQGNVVPSQMVDDGGPGSLYWIAMLPPKSATLYYLCEGAAPQPATDLQVQSQGGRTVLGNSRLTLEWDGSRGGTVTRFVSAATGRDYAAGSFGGGAGTWGKYDPLHPAIDTVSFVSQEQKAWQRDGKAPAQVKVTRQGPVLATVEVQSGAGTAKCTQTYTLLAYQPDFAVTGTIEARETTEELVPLDIRLARNRLTKIFPNFTGIAEGFTGDQPGAGWREAPYTPPYATLMEPDGFPESISIIPDAFGLLTGMKFRQGFWPEQRPKAGKVDFAEVEFCASNARQASATAQVLLHPGHQVVARDFRRSHVDEPPVVIVPKQFRWEGEVGQSSAAAPADWWNPYWHYAVPVSFSGEGPLVAFTPDVKALLGNRGELDPASLRAVVKQPGGLAELPTTYEPVTGEVTVTLNQAAPPAREFMLYFDTVANGPKRLVAAPLPWARELLGGGFEGGRYWTLEGGALVAENPHEGETCARLEVREGGGPAVITNGTFRVEPGSQYRVSFWVRTATPGAAVRTNFYSGATYDFPQVAIPLQSDGQWRRYQQVLPTGQFPAGVRPALRLWVLGKPQVVWVDDVDVEPVKVAAPPPVPVTVGELRVSQ